MLILTVNKNYFRKTLFRQICLTSTCTRCKLNSDIGCMFRNAYEDYNQLYKIYKKCFDNKIVLFDSKGDR